MRGARPDKRLQLRGIGTERAISSRQTGLQGLDRAIQDDNASRSLGDLPVHRIKECSTPERNNLIRSTGDTLKFSRLDRPEPLLPLFPEDLGNAPPLRPHDFRIKINERPPRCRGNPLRPRRLPARGRSIEKEG